jgi:hypothetical protein
MPRARPPRSRKTTHSNTCLPALLSYSEPSLAVLSKRKSPFPIVRTSGQGVSLCARSTVHTSMTERSNFPWQQEVLVLRPLPSMALLMALSWRTLVILAAVRTRCSRPISVFLAKRYNRISQVACRAHPERISNSDKWRGWHVFSHLSNGL